MYQTYIFINFWQVYKHLNQTYKIFNYTFERSKMQGMQTNANTPAAQSKACVCSVSKKKTRN